MTAVSGIFSGSVSMQSSAAIPDAPLHALMVGAVTGKHKSENALWDGAQNTQWGMCDLKDGQGRKTGYLRNEQLLQS